MNVLYPESIYALLVGFTGVGLIIYALIWPVLIICTATSGLAVLFFGSKGLRIVIGIIAGILVLLAGIFMSAPAGASGPYGSDYYSSGRPFQERYNSGYYDSTSPYYYGRYQPRYYAPTYVYPQYYVYPRYYQPCYSTSYRSSGGTSFSAGGCY